MMEKSIVSVSMRDENNLNCSYSIIQKEEVRIIIILRNLECAIFNYDELKNKNKFHYLLLKHYKNDELAYKDFLKLIGKMCKKTLESKYFLNYKDEDNRMLCVEIGNEHMISENEKLDNDKRYKEFKNFVIENIEKF